MATLTVTHSESIRLNGSQQGSTNNFSISDITQINKRIVTVPANQDITILNFRAALYTDADEVLLDADSGKYIRITNLDATNSVNLGIIGEADNYSVTLEAKQSYVLGKTKDSMNAESSDVTPSFTAFEDIQRILADTGANSVSVEIFVASSA